MLQIKIWRIIDAHSSKELRYLLFSIKSSFWLFKNNPSLKRGKGKFCGKVTHFFITFQKTLKLDQKTENKMENLRKS